MTTNACERIALADLTDYAAGELAEADAAAIEEHVFSCPDCAARAGMCERRRWASSTSCG